MRAWLANQIVAAFLLALRLGRRRGYAYLLSKADAWREAARARWWHYKLKTILSQQDPDDDMLADVLGRLWKFETPPAGSCWDIGYHQDGSCHYFPLPGSGYVADDHGGFLRVK